MIASIELPGAESAMMRTGRLGKSWACAGPAAMPRCASAHRDEMVNQRRVRLMGRSDCSLNMLPLAERDVAHRARRKKLVELDATRGQAVLEGVLQQRLDGRPVLLDAVRVPVAPDDRLLLLDHRLQPGE